MAKLTDYRSLLTWETSWMSFLIKGDYERRYSIPQGWGWSKHKALESNVEGLRKDRYWYSHFDILGDRLWARYFPLTVELLEYLKTNILTIKTKQSIQSSRSRQFFLMRRSREIILTTQTHQGNKQTSSTPQGKKKFLFPLIFALLTNNQGSKSGVLQIICTRSYMSRPKPLSQGELLTHRDEINNHKHCNRDHKIDGK